MRTGGARAGEYASVEEAQRELSRFRAEIEGELANANKNMNMDLAGSAETASSSPKINETLRFVRRGKNLVAEHRSDMATAIAKTYQILLPDMASTRSIVRARGGKITVTELQRHFRNTTFANASVADDWQTLIEEFSNKRSAGIRNLTIALLARRTGLSNATVATYTKPSRKRKKAAYR